MMAKPMKTTLKLHFPIALSAFVHDWEKETVVLRTFWSPETALVESRPLGATILKYKGFNRILPIRFHCAVYIYCACLKWLLPESLLFRPLVKGKEDSRNEMILRIEHQSEFYTVNSTWWRFLGQVKDVGSTTRKNVSSSLKVVFYLVTNFPKR